MPIPRVFFPRVDVYVDIDVDVGVDVDIGDVNIDAAGLRRGLSQGWLQQKMAMEKTSSQQGSKLRTSSLVPITMRSDLPRK